MNVMRSVLFRCCGSIPGFFLAIGLAWGSDSIVGWTNASTIVSNGNTTLSAGTIQPVFFAPGIGKYILIDGKRYIEAGTNRYALQSPPPNPASVQSDGTSHRRHHRHKKERSPSEDWKKIDAEKNAAMTPSQKIYRDLKKNIYPEVFEHR